MKDIEDEIPFEVPEGWAWCRLDFIVSRITDFVASGSFASLRQNVKYYDQKNYALLVRTADFSNNFANPVFTDEHGYNFLKNSNLFGGELILPNIGASIGKVFIVPNLKQLMTLAPNSILIGVENSNLRLFLYYLFLSPFGQGTLQSISSSSAQAKFNKTELRKILIPVSPTEEQAIIVSKIEEIFSKITCLENGKADLQAAIKHAKSKILDLAIHGKLVPQDPSEEPASKLLEKIRAEKEVKIAAGELKRDKNDSYIYKNPSDNCHYEKFADGEIVTIETSYAIPDNWQWCRVKECFDVTMGQSPEGSAVMPNRNLD